VPHIDASRVIIRIYYVLYFWGVGVRKVSYS